MDYRIEKDTLGEVKVPSDKFWGAQTQRSKHNFPIGIEKMPIEIIKAFAITKKACATANHSLGLLEKEKAEAIGYAAEQVLADKLTDQFPLVVWQTGSGTQSNMNVNEVLAFVGNKWLKEQGSDLVLHPNDDVNKSQSSNDTYPTALHVAAVLKLEDTVLPAVKVLKDTIGKKSDQFKNVVKIGRTHLQDATPITLGQEMSGWHRMLEKAELMIQEGAEHLKDLAIGGTAVGTGLNAHPDYAEKVCAEISTNTGKAFRSEPVKFHSLTSYDETVFAHGALKALAADLMKIANDVRWLASGPRSGFGEITIPANEPGSSIMPGKVNPTQAEAITMAAVRVTGNDVVVGMASSQGNFEMNVYKPVLIEAFLESADLLAGTMRGFADKMISGLTVNENRMKELVDNSLMTVTALSPHIGYHDSAKIAQKADKEGTTLREAAIASGKVTPEQFDEWVDPLKMTNIDR